MDEAGIEAVELGRIEARGAMGNHGEIEPLGDGVEAGIGLDGKAGAGQRRHDRNGQRLIAFGPEVGDGLGAEALGKALALRIGEEIVVRELRDRAAQSLDDLDLGAGIGDVVLAADDVGDAQVDVVDDRGERIEIAAIGADQHRIGHGGGIDRLRALDEVSKWTGRPSRRKRQCGWRPSASRRARSSSVSARAARS